MEQLKQRILEDGTVKPGNVLKVDSFLNHQIDIAFMNQIGAEFARRFAGSPVNKILTIEASGIGIAAICAQHFDNAPVVFAKKSKSLNLDGDLYHARVESFTHKTVSDVVVSKKFLSPDDHVLVIDDFLANGCALEASSRSLASPAPPSKAVASSSKKASSTAATACASAASASNPSPSSKKCQTPP